jgi:D-alanine-D-alanine ligase
MTPDQPAARKPRVAVVFGGRSSEHAVSCATAAGVMRAIDRDTYDVVPIGISRDGHWVLTDGDPDRLALTSTSTPEVTADGAGVVIPLATTDRTLVTLEPREVPKSLGEVDVVFPLLHGPFGEDGTIQGLFEMADIRYVGSGVFASAAGMDKHHMKVIFAGAGLPVGPYVVITDAQWRRDRAAAMDAVGALTYPVFVKPARAGSSMGISKVSTPEALEGAIELARTHDRKVVVEQGIVGREIECAVLQGHGTDEPRVSHVGEIEVTAAGGHEFYDFEAKYLDDGAVLSCPAAVPDHVAAEVQRLAREAFEALGCEGLARVDCFYTDTGEVVVNEINTMPGFTPHSMYPQMWEATGLPYRDLIDELLQLALTRPVGLR